MPEDPPQTLEAAVGQLALAYRDDEQWTPESIREREHEKAAGGVDARVAVAVSEADGTVVGVTNAWPELERIHTSNPVGGRHILAVNRALGYQPLREMIQTETATQRLLDTLDTLAKLG